MNYWLVPINTADFDFNQYLGKYHFVDWVQFDDRIQIDDIAYIYDSKQKRITHKMVVSAVSFDFDQATNDENLWHNRTKMLENISEDVFYRLKPVQTVESKLLGYENLKVHNFPENPIHDFIVDGNLRVYITSILESEDEIDRKKKAAEDALHEGGSIRVVLDRYERSKDARKECIAHYRNEYRCVICGFNFKEKYGEYGEGFIEVHHIKKLSKQKKRQKVDYENDLIPVCSNCHSMIHHKRENEELDLKGLKDLLIPSPKTDY